MSTNKKIKPVLRYFGSKYRKVDVISKYLDMDQTSNFIDVFGGSGIVGVNMKHKHDCKVTINDFDKILDLKLKKVLMNQCSFNGKGINNITKQAIIQFNRMLNNGYFERYDIYKEVLANCNIVSSDYLDLDLTEYTHLYLDPPYLNVEGWYIKDKINLDHFYNKLKDLKGKILISLNDSQPIRDKFKDWKIITEPYVYVNTNKKKEVDELFIANFDI